MTDGVPLALCHRAEVEARLARRREALGRRTLSEFSFANLYLFRQIHHYHYVTGPLPYITGVTYDGATHILPLFALTEASADDIACLLQGGRCLFPVPEEELPCLDPNRFEWHANRDDADYLYDGSCFADYPGGALRKKRQEVRRLISASTVECTPFSRDSLSVASAVLDVWMADKGKAPGQTDDAACREALANAAALGLAGYTFHVDGVPAGFVLTESLAAGCLAVRFAKGLDDFPGIYPFMFRQVASETAWLNFEQDLGNPNFRRSKLSFRPAALLSKYRIALRS